MNRNSVVSALTSLFILFSCGGSNSTESPQCIVCDQENGSDKCDPVKTEDKETCVENSSKDCNDGKDINDENVTVRKGGEGEPCFDHGVCDRLEDGTRLVCVDDICRKPDCSAVDARSAGCLCGGEKECKNGLVCLNGNCVEDTGQTLNAPKSPKCFTPCKGGYLIGKDGKTRECSHEGLIEGCIDDNVCHMGSCVPADRMFRKNGKLFVRNTEGEEEPGACEKNSDCPSHQTCIENKCYSDCEIDEDCNGNRKCFKKVCRVECNTSEQTSDNNICPTGEVCSPINDNATGYCIPLSSTSKEADSTDDPSSDDVESDFVISEKTLFFSPRETKRILVFINKTKSPRTIVVSKYSHVSVGDQEKTYENPLFWLKMGQYESDLTDEGKIELVVPGNGGETGLIIADAKNGSVQRWDGELKVESQGKPARIVNLQYVGTAEGRWDGKAYYFANFGERSLNEWIADKDNDEKLSSVGNAFIRRWNAFKKGRISYDEFMAVLKATQLESWKWESVKKRCPDKENPNENIACYLYDNGTGISIYTDDIQYNPVPTGVNDFKVAVNIHKNPAGSDSKQWIGKVISSASLQYNGDPQLSVSFASDPGVCSSSPGSPCITFLNSFDFNVNVGARFILENGRCSRYPGFEEAKVPWLIPGFKRNTTENEYNQRFFHECRDTRLPYQDNGAMKEINKSLALANPIPDGAQRKREIQLIDGAMIDQENMVIIFKEKFLSFWGEEDEEGFSTYGYMILNHSSETPEEEEYKGNEAPEVKSRSLINNVSCSDNVLENIRMSLNETTASHAALALIDGVKPGNSDPQMLNRDNNYLYCFHETCEAVHYYCEDTNLFNGGKNDDGSTSGRQIECPEGSKVTFFTLTGKFEEVGRSAVAQLACQLEECSNIDLDDDGKVDIAAKENCGCQKTLNDWIKSKTYNIKTDPGFKCSNCNKSRLDLRDGKEFFQVNNSEVVSLPVDYDIKQAFRYKTKFRNRSGNSVGFAPKVCIENSNMVPYCYDPEAIEKIEEKMDCAIHIYTEYYDKLNSQARAKLKEYLVTSFSYKETYVEGLDKPVIDDGFEDLYAELLVMQGDESFTSAYASRFDLAGSNLAPFVGSLFEPSGIDLEGNAGFEMYRLYQAVQYYQKALNRFYKLSPTMRKLKDLPDGEGFITPATVVTWFESLTKASSKKARAWSEISKRYQRFNRPDLARLVIERAYVAAHLESVVLSKIMKKVITLSGSSYENQIKYQLEMTQRVFRVAMLDMLNEYKNITDNITYFGYAPDYIPFPVLEHMDKNPFLKHYIQAESDLMLAKEKERLALEDNRNFETSSAAFQTELVKIEREYENQLMDICGSFKVITPGGQTLVYPAITKYAELNPTAKALGDPCGLMGNGAIADAIKQLEIAQLNIASIKQSKENLDAEMQGASARTKAQCDRIEDFMEIKIENQGKINSLNIVNNALQSTIGFIDKYAGFVSQLLQLQKCSMIFGMSNGGDCPTSVPALVAFIGVNAAQIASTTALDAAININQAEIMDIEKSMVKNDVLEECNAMKIDLVFTLKEMYRRNLELNLEALKMQKQLALAFSEIEKWRNKACSLIEQMNETTEMTINVEAVRNDPNVRIYRNDTIMAADKTFYAALQQVYIATILYEYYTSQSYAEKEKLFLIRMVSHGENSLELYLSDLRKAFQDFEYEYGLPQDRVVRLSLKDDILAIPKLNDDGTAYGIDQRTEMLRKKLKDTAFLDENGYITIPFSTNLGMVSPLTSSHKIEYLEAKILGTNKGDQSARIYVRQKGTGTLRTLKEGKMFYALPERTAVLEAYLEAGKYYDPEVYKNERFRGRPFVNSNWELIINKKDERVNEDLNLGSVDDIYLYVYYSDFTGE